MTAALPRPTLRSLRIADDPERWQALGFTVERGQLQLGEVTLELTGGRGGIVAWRLEGIEPVASMDGLATEVLDPATPPQHPASHANGALTVDHVVIATPDFDRTSAALAQAGLGLRRVREAPGGVRQGFRRLGQTILELVEAAAPPDPAGPARFWGLVIVVSDLDALAQQLGSVLGAVRDAVQPGRRIATLRAGAGISPALAFMTPEPG